MVAEPGRHEKIWHRRGVRGLRADPVQSPSGSTVLETGTEETEIDKSSTSTIEDPDTSSGRSVELVPTLESNKERSLAVSPASSQKKTKNNSFAVSPASDQGQEGKDLDLAVSPANQEEGGDRECMGKKRGQRSQEAKERRIERGVLLRSLAGSELGRAVSTRRVYG